MSLYSREPVYLLLDGLWVLVALVETRTYIAMFIAVLVSEQREGLVFQARLIPLHKRLIAAIPSRASIRLFDVAVPNVPLMACYGGRGLLYPLAVRRYAAACLCS